jgi:elongation factor G
MASQYKLEVDTKPPRIPYRETITGSAEAMPPQEAVGRRRPVWRSASAHRAEGPRRGLRVCRCGQGRGDSRRLHGGGREGRAPGLEGGVVAGYAVDDLKVTVFDGKTHAVDGKEVAFVVAGRKAVIEAIRNAPSRSSWSRSSISRSSSRKAPSATWPATCPAVAATSPAPTGAATAWRRSPAKCRWPS